MESFGSSSLSLKHCVHFFIVQDNNDNILVQRLDRCAPCKGLKTCIMHLASLHVNPIGLRGLKRTGIQLLTTLKMIKLLVFDLRVCETDT